MGWIVSPLKRICCVPTPGTSGCGTYLETESLQMQLVKTRSHWRRLGSQSKMISIPKGGGSGHRPVLREDAKCTWRQPPIWQENGPEQRLPSQPAEGTSPDNTVLSDFSPPELWDDTLLLLKASPSSHLLQQPKQTTTLPEETQALTSQTTLNFFSSKGPVVLLYFGKINYRRLLNLSAHFFPALPERTLSECSS